MRRASAEVGLNLAENLALAFSLSGFDQRVRAEFWGCAAADFSKDSVLNPLPRALRTRHQKGLSLALLAAEIGWALAAQGGAG